MRKWTWMGKYLGSDPLSLRPAITHGCTGCELHHPLGCCSLDCALWQLACIGQPSRGLNKWPIKWVILLSWVDSDISVSVISTTCAFHPLEEEPGGDGGGFSWGVGTFCWGRGFPRLTRTAQVSQDLADWAKKSQKRVCCPAGHHWHQKDLKSCICQTSLIVPLKLSKSFFHFYVNKWISLITHVQNNESHLWSNSAVTFKSWMQYVCYQNEGSANQVLFSFLIQLLLLLLFGGWVMSDSLATPWTVAHQAAEPPGKRIYLLSFNYVCEVLADLNARMKRDHLYMESYSVSYLCKKF